MERALEEALAALRNHPAKPSWRAGAGRWLAAMAGLGVCLVVGLGASGAFAWGHLLERAPVLAGLVASQALCVWAASAPRGYRMKWPALAAGGLALVAIVATRAAPTAPPLTPAWVCSASHLAVDAFPLWLAWRVLRRSAPASWRAAAAGLAVGATGAFLGELACGRGWAHVAVFHLGVWIAVTVVSVVWNRLRTPISYAP